MKLKRQKISICWTAPTWDMHIYIVQKFGGAVWVNMEDIYIDMHKTWSFCVGQLASLGRLWTGAWTLKQGHDWSREEAKKEAKRGSVVTRPGPGMLTHINTEESTRQPPWSWVFSKCAHFGSREPNKSGGFLSLFREVHHLLGSW